MQRRQFMQQAAAATAMGSCFPAGLAALERDTRPGGLERRALGKTGVKLSVIGFGSLVLKDVDPAEASRWVGKAYNAGVNYFDVAPSYGNPEERLGPALPPYRDQVFLACKTAERRRDGARTELEQSLKRLRTDHVDLDQLHAVAGRSEVP
jgi:aryl-alcohol dehydrogenase-like predicted oxidoreductase